MAIRPVRNINELNLNAFKQVFKSMRDVGTGQNFANLFVAGLEHILIYTKGAKIEEFIRTVLSMIRAEELDSLREAFNDVFEDLEELILKKQMKILTSMIYDYNFSNFLTNFAEIIEIPINKSSFNESFNEIFFLSERMKLNIKIVNAKWKESNLVKSDGIVSLYLFDDKGKFLVLFPLEYKEFYNESKEKSKNLDDAEEDMRKINYLDFECKASARSLSEVVKGDRKRDFSLGCEKDEKEERMRNRAKLLKIKREQKRIEEQNKKAEEKRLEELRKQELEKERIEKEREEFERMKDRIKIEEENKQLKEWKLSEDLKKAHHQAQTLKDIESNTFNPDYFSKEMIQVIESLHRTEAEKLHGERDLIEDQRNQIERLLHEKEKLNEELIQSAQKMKDEEHKLIEEKALYSLRKQELQQIIAAEREELVNKQKAEEKKLNEQKEKLELMRIEEFKKLDNEKRKIEQRRLSEDKKIAEQKRIAADMKLNEMKKMIEELKIRSKTPQDSNKSFTTFSSKPYEHTSDTQKTIQGIISSIEKSQKHKRNSSHCPKVSQLHDEPTEKPQSRPITAVPLHPPDENFIKNCTKYKNRLKLSQPLQMHPNPEPNPMSPPNPSNPTNPPNPKNPSLLSFNSLSSVSSSLSSKQDTWLEHQKKLIESRKLELGKILENTKKFEFKRDSKRRGKEDKSVLEESKKILESKKRTKGGRFTCLAEHVQNSSMVESNSKHPGSVLEFGFFDEIFNKSFNVSDELYIDPLQDIREFKSKHLNESEVEFIEKKKNEAYIKLEPVKIIEDLQDIDEVVPKTEDKTCEKGGESEIIEKVEENVGFCDNRSICGGVYCQGCIKDLKKSSLYLRCNTCCVKFDISNTSSTEKKVTPSRKQICLKCSNKVLKGEEIWCFCCFVQLKIQKKPFTFCESCQNPKKLCWIDASSGNAMILCNFCGETRDKNCVLEICGRCQELICIICLRKNPYLASSVCLVCLNRRQVKVHV